MVDSVLQNQKSPFMVVLENLREKYTEPSKPPTESFDPPFQGQDVRTCSQTLHRMAEQTESDLDTEMFALLDDRSAEDSSATLALVMQDEENAGEVTIETVRVDLSLVSSILATWMAKGDNMDELQAQADSSPDGVVRE